MYFDAAVVFVTNSSLLFRLAVAILWFALFQEFWSVHAANIHDRIFVKVLSYIFFYFKVPNVRMYLLNPFLKLVRWKKCRRMPWQKFLFFYIYLFLFCRVPLAEILVICGFLMIYLIEELAHVLLHKVRSAEKSKDECSIACTGMKSSINSISRYKWSSTYAISTVAQFPPSYAIFPSFFPSYSISPKVIWIVQFVFHTDWKQNKFLFSCPNCMKQFVALI